MTVIRALVAAGLSVVFPGAGHALLRDWVRALLFAGLFISALAITLPLGEVMAASSISDLTALISQDVSQIDRFVLSFVILFAAVDAGLRGANFPPGSNPDTDGPSCPHCGRELDADIDFCHWCTTRIEFEPNVEEPEDS